MRTMLKYDFKLTLSKLKSVSILLSFNNFKIVLEQKNLIHFCRVLMQCTTILKIIVKCKLTYTKFIYSITLRATLYKTRHENE